MKSHKLINYKLLVLILVLSATFLISCGTTPESKLKAIAENAQKTCPQVLDEHTSMTSVEFVSPRTLKYTYLTKTEFSEEEKIMMEAGMKNVLLDVLKKQPELSFYQENEVSFEHRFQDKDKQAIVLVNISPSDYR